MHMAHYYFLFVTQKILYLGLSVILNYPGTSLIESTLYSGKSCYLHIKCIYLSTGPQGVSPQKIQQNILRRADASCGRMASKPDFRVPTLSLSSDPWCRGQRWFSKHRFTRRSTTWRGCYPESILLNLVALRALNTTSQKMFLKVGKYLYFFNLLQYAYFIKF